MHISSSLSFAPKYSPKSNAPPTLFVPADGDGDDSGGDGDGDGSGGDGDGDGSVGGRRLHAAAVKVQKVVRMRSMQVHFQFAVSAFYFRQW